MTEESVMSQRPAERARVGTSTLARTGGRRGRAVQRARLPRTVCRFHAA
jgi:hypothetical protein